MGYFNHDNQHHVLEVVVTHDIEPETFEAYAALNVVCYTDAMQTHQNY
ncbi:hypothetical protein O9992_28485 [Vibrio lentus]|nr:hypothetical protein [Vibrio lentus]